MEKFNIIITELFEGFGQTVLLFAIVLLISLPLGLIMALGSMSKFKPLKFLIKIIIWIIRGTPLLLQILLVSLIPKYVFDISTKKIASDLNCMVADVLFIYVIIAFSINYACYFAEIYRAGIQSISHGQTEAGQVLGMTKSQIFFKVILMQVIKRIIPPMSNEIITLVKDTALASVLGVVDLYNAAAHAVNAYVILTPLLYAAIFYLVFNGLLTLLFGYAEKKLSYYKV